jgi:uncharacterized membrane protein
MALLRCKSCGYLIEEGALKDVCPACGVPRKMLEPFSDTVSARRRQILSLDIHPVIVHWAVSFAVSALVLALVALTLPGLFVSTVRGGLRVLGGTLPLITVAAFIAGRIDGKIRFRKAKSRVLRLKTVTGIIFFTLAAAASAIILLVGPHVPWARVVDAVLLLGCTLCAFILGRAGARLLCAMFPG